MKHLDFTIDFETCSLGANAAPMQVAIVPWRREANDDPFAVDDGFVVAEDVADAWPEPYVGYVDLRTCVVDGFDFDSSTVKWWTEKSEAAKRAVCAGLAEPVTDVLVSALDYIRDIVAQYQLDSICLWCQGMDVDVAILRNLCRKYDIDLEDTIPHTQFRDCRTAIMEAALVRAQRLYHEAIAKAETILADGTPIPQPAVTPQAILDDPAKAYILFDPLPDDIARGSEAHDALYDALRSSWNTWQALKWLRQ
ncbi:MAG: 3'-5' exoribonuclease [Prevotella sp.]|nr:3'-5' exoribonuclease [Prevotella sp.]